MTALIARAQLTRTVQGNSLQQSTAHYLVKNVPIAYPGETGGAVCERIIGRRYDDASHVFLLDDDGKLAGVAEIGDVISAPATTLVAAFAKDINSYVVTPDTDREEAASTAIRAGLSVLGVCDANSRFIGAVPAAALISILRDEHLEDLHHMAGILSKSETAKAALAAPPHRRALYRLPWLLIGMAGSALATAMMAGFEAALTAHISVAFFVPAIVYLADAVGTQSEVVTVRGLSLSAVDLAPLFFGELGTSILVGAALGASAYPFVWLVFDNAALAATVAIALAVACVVATAAGILLPWLFAKLDYDPALASGPIATVFQDVLSLLTYFLVASMLVF